jgi:hypothetical protein
MKRRKKKTAPSPETAVTGCGMRELIEGFRRKHATSLKKFAFEELAALRDTGKR